MDCSSHGHCDDGKCECESDRYGGEHCEVDCGEHGAGQLDGTCKCKPGFGTKGEHPCAVDGRTRFPESRLITPEWALQLNGWAGKLDREWSLCCSTFEGCNTAAKFHAACDAHTPTLTVAHNAGGRRHKNERL